MAKRVYDTAFLNARREACVVVAFFAVVLVYTCGYCYLFGYDRDPATLTTYWGIPDWVLWGVMAPWLASAVFTFWFCFRFMADDPLDPAVSGADRANE